MKSKLLVLLLAAGLLLSLAACGPKAPAGPTVVKVTLTEFKITMDQTTLPAGPITFEITNNGAIDHEVVIEPAGANDEPFSLNGVESEKEDIHPGDTVTLDWTLEPGDYQLSCHVPGHFEAGMYTTFTVK